LKCTFVFIPFHYKLKGFERIVSHYSGSMVSIPCIGSRQNIWELEKLEDIKDVKSEVLYRRKTDYIMVKEKGQTKIYKTLHIKD
jgi:hypothetical protein